MFMKLTLKKIIFPIILIWFLLVIDLLTKYFFYDLKIAENLFFIHPILNTGISRSLPIHSVISIIIAFFAILLFAWLYFKNKIAGWIMAFLIAWTIWNMIDRIFLWGVRDFLMPFQWFPIFNIADIFLSIWVGVYLWKEFFTWKNKLKK